MDVSALPKHKTVSPPPYFVLFYSGLFLTQVEINYYRRGNRHLFVMSLSKLL